MNKKNYVNYSNYGTFRVTTEGDCEGKSSKDLGIHTGYIDEIAFALADKCYYTLRFSLIKPPKPLDMTPKKDKVNISLDINSGTWDLKVDESMKYFKEFFADRDVTVINACGNGRCTISTNNETIEEKRTAILNKLTEEEKQILGL